VERTFTVAEASGEMGEDGHLGPVTCRPVVVSLDEAGDLADSLIGGPLVTLDMAGAREGFLSDWHFLWRLTARGLVEAEALAGLEQARLLLLDGLDEQIAFRQVWRLCAGELSPATLPPVPQGQGPGGVPGPAVWAVRRSVEGGGPARCLLPPAGHCGVVDAGEAGLCIMPAGQPCPLGGRLVRSATEVPYRPVAANCMPLT
jgi:hypothetical protein